MATPPAANSDSISGKGHLQRFEIQDLDDVRAVLDTVDFSPMVMAISPDPAIRGPKPYPRLPIIRAHFAGYLIKPRVDSITALDTRTAERARCTLFPNLGPAPNVGTLQTSYGL